MKIDVHFDWVPFDSLVVTWHGIKLDTSQITRYKNWRRQHTTHALACENIRFSSLFVAEDVSRETSSATKSEEKRMFSQATHTLGRNLTFRASL